LDEAEKAGSAMRRLMHRELTHEIIGAFFKVYNAFGYGFLETPYVNALVQHPITSASSGRERLSKPRSILPFPDHPPHPRGKNFLSLRRYQIRSGCARVRA
jgi:hypothetical protein